jgi:cytochrome c
VVTAALLAENKAHAGDIALGEYLSAECLTCHQLSGHSTGGIPPIVGITEHHFVETLNAYKNGERRNEVMRNIAARLSLEDMAAIAAYFATQKPK